MSALRINLGCGNRPLTGFVNVDLLEGPGVDIIADVTQRLPFDDGSAELIYASHVLEHQPTARVPEVLREWRRILGEGGSLLIAVPDLERIAELLITRPGWFTPPHEPFIGAIYGGQKDGFDFHKTGFAEVWLASLLTDAGFGSTRRVERFPEIGANDGSWSVQPFGTNISLNMRAVAGGQYLPSDLLSHTMLEAAFTPLERLLAVGMRGSSYLRARVMQRRRRRLQRAISGGESGHI